MEKRTIRRVDKIQEQLPEEHEEFGTCAKIGERLSGGSYLSSVQAIEGVDALESLAKRSKNRRKR
jgi:CobQ-like glutamine amidotransferase family enzyme